MPPPIIPPCLVLLLLIALLGSLWTGVLSTLIGLREAMMVGPFILLLMIVTVLSTQRKIRKLHEDPAHDR